MDRNEFNLISAGSVVQHTMYGNKEYAGLFGEVISTDPKRGVEVLWDGQVQTVFYDDGSYFEPGCILYDWIEANWEEPV